MDVVLTPGAPKPAQAMAEAEASTLRRTGPSFTNLFNQTGLPSFAIPDGFSRDGLPLSLMISGRPFDEATVLRVGYAHERATEWHTRHPSL